MPIPKAVARANRVVTNKILGPLAARAPGFGIVLHQGRRSGRSYRTPVNVFRRPGGYVIALTYGPDADWVRNVLAAGGCVVELKRRPVRLVEPRVVHDETRRHMPPVVRQVLGALRVADFLYLATAPTPSIKD